MVPETTALKTVLGDNEAIRYQDAEQAIGPDNARAALTLLRQSQETFANPADITVLSPTVPEGGQVSISFLDVPENPPTFSIQPLSETSIPPGILDKAKAEGALVGPEDLVIKTDHTVDFFYPEPSIAPDFFEPAGQEPLPLYVTLPVKTGDRYRPVLGIRHPADQIKISVSSSKENHSRTAEALTTTPEPAFSNPDQAIVSNDPPLVSQTELLSAAPADVVQNLDQTIAPTFVTAAEESNPGPEPATLPPLAANDTISTPPLATVTETIATPTLNLEPVTETTPLVAQTEPSLDTPNPTPEPPPAVKPVEIASATPPTPEPNLPPPPEATTPTEAPAPTPANAEKHNLSGAEAQKVAAFLSDMMRSQEKNSLNSWLKAITNPKATPQDRQQNLQLFQDALQNAPAETKPLHQIALDMLQDLANTINHYETLDKSNPAFIQDKKLLKKTYQLSPNAIQTHMDQANQAQLDWEQNQKLQRYLDYHVHIWTAHWAGQKTW